VSVGRGIVGNQADSCTVTYDAVTNRTTRNCKCVIRPSTGDKACNYIFGASGSISTSYTYTTTSTIWVRFISLSKERPNQKALKFI